MQRNRTFSFAVIFIAFTSCIFLQVAQGRKKDQFREIEGGALEFEGDLGGSFDNNNGFNDFNGGVNFNQRAAARNANQEASFNDGPILDYASNGPFGGNRAADVFDGEDFFDGASSSNSAANGILDNPVNAIRNRANRFVDDLNPPGFVNGEGEFFPENRNGYKFITELTWLPPIPFPTTTDYNGTTFSISTSTHYRDGRWNCYTTEWNDRRPFNPGWNDWWEYEDYNNNDNGYYVFPDSGNGNNEDDGGEYYPYAPMQPMNVLQDQNVNINIARGTQRILTEEVYRGGNGIVTTMLIETAISPGFQDNNAGANQRSNFPSNGSNPTKASSANQPSSTQPQGSSPVFGQSAGNPNNSPGGTLIFSPVVTQASAPPSQGAFPPLIVRSSGFTPGQNGTAPLIVNNPGTNQGQNPSTPLFFNNSGIPAGQNGSAPLIVNTSSTNQGLNPSTPLFFSNPGNAPIFSNGIPQFQNNSAPFILNNPAVQRVASSIPFLNPIVNGVTSGVVNTLVGNVPSIQSIVGSNPIQRIVNNAASPPIVQQGPVRAPAQAPVQGPIQGPIQAPIQTQVQPPSPPILLPSTKTEAATRTPSPRTTKTLDLSSSEMFDSDYISLSSDAGFSHRKTLKSILIGAGVGILAIVVF